MFTNEAVLNYIVLLVRIAIDYAMSAWLFTMLTLCQCSCLLHGHRASIVIDYADTVSVDYVDMLSVDYVDMC